MLCVRQNDGGLFLVVLFASILFFTHEIKLTGNSIKLHKHSCFTIQACDGIELLDMLFDKNDGILCHENVMNHNDQPWSMQDPNVSDASNRLHHLQHISLDF